MVKQNLRFIFNRSRIIFIYLSANNNVWNFIDYFSLLNIIYKKEKFLITLRINYLMKNNEC